MKYVHTKFEDHWPKRMRVIRVNASLHKNFNQRRRDYNSSPYSSNRLANNKHNTNDDEDDGDDSIYNNNNDFILPFTNCTADTF